MSAVRPECPRCGYDVSGVVATWAQACPMRGLCSECGLEFDWGRVLSPRTLGPRWSFEHRRGVRSWLSTSRVSLNPWRLTRDLSIDHQIRPARLVLFLGSWVIGWYILFGLARITNEVGPGLLLGAPSAIPADSWAAAVRAFLWPYGTLELRWSAGYSSSGSLLPVLIVAYMPAVLMPLLMMVLGETFRRAAARKWHLLRAVAYTAPGSVIFLHVEIALFVGLLAMGGFGGPPVLEPLLIMGTVIGYLVWLGVWWWLFVKHYLRLTHAGAIAIVLMFTSVLALVTLFASLAAWGGVR